MRISSASTEDEDESASPDESLLLSEEFSPLDSLEEDSPDGSLEEDSSPDELSGSLLAELSPSLLEEDSSLLEEDSSLLEENSSLLEEDSPLLSEENSSLPLLSLSALELLSGTGRGGRGCHSRGERPIPS